MKTAATLAAAALLLGGAEAACPNQCSGHGYCDENDRCICFRGPGTKGQLRDTWTGYDCSQRVCPYGDSHDYISDSTMEFLEVNAGAANPYMGFIPAAGTSGQSRLKAFLNNGFLLKRDTGLDVKVVSVNGATGDAKFQWKLSSEKTFNAEVDFSASLYGSKALAYHVRPDTDGDGVGEDSGLFLYWDLASTNYLLTASQQVFAGDRYYLNVTWNEGKNLMLTDLNTAHPGMECSGRGTCDRSSGMCKCVAGFTGDACQRTACAKDCNGHGTCQSLQYFVQEGTADLLDYTGVDAQQQFGCKCDPGFRGYDCSKVECPSGADPLGGLGGAEGQDCSGRGMCDYTTGTCKCFKGYFGERCEELSTLV